MLNFTHQDTACTADPLQVKLGAENGDFSFNAFAFDQNDQSLRIVCQFLLCLTSENCFEPNDDDCDEYYSKQVSTEGVCTSEIMFKGQ